MNSGSLTGQQLYVLEQNALDVVRELAQLALTYFHKTLAIEHKPDKSLVSEADKNIEKKARELLASITPFYGFVGEEFGTMRVLGDKDFSQHHESQQTEFASGLNQYEVLLQQKPRPGLNLDEDTYWILDPIDGTLNFLSHVPQWSVLLALVQKGRPILGVVALPALNEVFIASVGQGARWGALMSDQLSRNDQSHWKPCVPRKTKIIAEAFVSYSTPKTFSYRGIESFLAVLQADSFECRSHSDAFGYTRILSGGIDAMIDPLVAPYDVAALQVLFDETPGAAFTNLHGNKGDHRYRSGSVIAAATTDLAAALLKSYRSHLLETANDYCASSPEITSPMLPSNFKPTFLLPFEVGVSIHPAKNWARAIETAVSAFLQQNTDAFVEDVSVLIGTRESASRILSNGKDEAPPDVSASSSYHVRAIVSGGTGLVSGTFGDDLSPFECILAALDAAWRQIENCRFEGSNARLLAARDQVISHCGQHPWQVSRFATEFEKTSRLVQEFHLESHDTRIHSLKSRLNLSSEYQWQYFLDSAQQTFVNQVTRVSTNATCSEGSEKRVAYARLLENRFPDTEKLRNDLKRHFLKVTTQSIDLLSATLVPEEPEYDYLAVDADLVGLILHEAIGHAAEGDLIQTGASGFGQDGKMRDLQVGPEWLNIIIDGSLDNCGYLPVDAEGVLPQRKFLVNKGRLVDSIHTRHTAFISGKTPDGCARLQSLQYPSLNRMTSIWVCPEKSKKIDSLAEFSWDDIPPEIIQESLQKHGYLDGEKGVLLLSGWKGGTASCSNLEFRADVARLLLLKKGEAPLKMREANFTGIATECFRSAIDSFGPTLCRSIGTCGKDGQGVLTSDGGPAFMVFTPDAKVRVIGTGDAQGSDE